MPLLRFVKQVFQEFGKDRIGQLSAAFAYSAIFALGPLLLVLVSIVGFVYGEQAAQGKLFSQLAGTLGADAARTIQNLVARTYQSGNGALAFTIGIIGVLFGAAGITTQLQSSFNQILGIVPDPKGGIKRTVYVRFKNMLLVLLAGIVVTVSVIMSAVVNGLGSSAQQNLDLPPIVLELINNAVSLAILIGLLYALYRVVPDVVVPRKIVLTASAVVTLLFVIGKIVLGIVIGNNGTASAYGAAASLIVLLLWVYYSGQILFIGAEGMKVYGHNHSITYKPKRFNLKRTTLYIDQNNIRGRFMEAWVRGFRKSKTK